MENTASKSKLQLTTCLFVTVAATVTLVALLTSDYPPWGIFWIGRGLLVSLAGALFGTIVSITLAKPKAAASLSKSVPSMLGLMGISIFWALIVAIFNSNQNPAENPFDVPVWPELYQAVLFVSCGTAWFWWHRSRDALLPGLLLVILAATSDGMLFNHYTLATTYLFLAMTGLWVGMVLFSRGLPSLRNVVMGGGLVLILISLIASIQGVSFGDSINFIWRLMSGWFIAIGIISLKRDKERKKQLLWVLISSGILITALTLIRYLYLAPIIGVGNSLSFRLSLAKADSNALGAAMIMPIALLFFIRNSFKEKHQTLIWVLILLMLLPVFFSLSKSLWMGIGLMIVLGFVISGRNWKRYLLFLLILILLVSLSAVIFPVIRDRIFDQFSVSFRQLIWQTVFRSISARPVLGVGPYNTFVHATFANGFPYEKVFFDRYYLTSHTHSLWLELTEGTGLIGLLCFAIILVMVLKQTTRDCNWIIAALAGLLLSLSFMGGLSSFNLIPYDLWILLALLARSSRKPRLWFATLLLPVMLIGSLGMTAEFYKRRAEVELAHTNLESGLKEIRQAQQFNPFSVEYPALEANIHILDDNFPQALSCYDRCVAKSPLHPVWRSKRGVTRLIMGDVDGAITDLEVAEGSDYWGVTGFGDLHGPFAAALATAGLNDRAIENLKTAAILNPGFPASPWGALVQTTNGLACCLCPDFSPNGLEFERYLRCKNWLTSYSFPSSSSFRQVYPEEMTQIYYAPIVYEQLIKQDFNSYDSHVSNKLPVFTLGSSYFAVRYAEGRIGADLALLFGDIRKIPTSFLNLINLGGSQSSMNQFYHIYRNLGLAIFARQSGNLSLANLLTEEASSKNYFIAPRQVTYYDEAASKIVSLFPDETIDTLQDKLVLEIENRKFNQVKGTIRKLLYGYITTNTGYERAGFLAQMLNNAPGIKSGIMADSFAAFDNTPLLLLINAYNHQLDGDDKSARKSLDRAIASAPHDRPLSAAYFNALINLNYPREASLFAETYLAQEPYDVDGLVNFAQNLAQLGYFDISHKILEHLLASFPNIPRSYLLQAFIAGQEKKDALELQALTKAYSMAPTDMDTIGSLINRHLSHKDFTAASYYLQRGLEINPANLNLWMSGVALAESTDQPAQALESARFAYNIDPTSSWVATTLVAQLVNANQPNEALEVINGVLSRDPNDANALYWRAKVYEKQGNKEKAMADYEKLVGTRGAALNIYVELANMRMEQKRTDDAIRLMQQATTMYPNDAWGWATLGDIARRAHVYTVAREALDKAVALEPSNESYRNLRKNVEKIPLADLVTDCEKALAAGDKSGALTKAEAAVKEYPTESWAWANLAYMAHQAGNKQRARTAIVKAIELAPENKTWQKLRIEIEK